MDYQAELEETQRSLREVTLMIEQSQGELTKLTQRNTAITAHLQQVQKGASPEEVKMAYDSALDAQQRLFVMRGQLEKLQNDKTHLEKYKATLESLVSDSSASAESETQTSSKGQMAGIEMIVNAQEAERQRLSRQMHDGPAQALSNFILQTEIATRLLDADPALAKEELGNLKSSAMGTFQKVRNYIFELRPMMLDDLGLVPTLRKYAEAFKEQTSLDVSLSVTGAERRLEPYLEVMIFRATQELLGNASRHSQASSVKAQVDMGNESIRVSVDDNGKGFDPEILKQENNLGLKIIRERAEMLGGSFEIDSMAGSGARITFSVPAK
ncbi:MAG: sensor histidine kinase [Anaerolineales bacterium]|nr:sensor histidine kinase [Anaerolineales bacterium]